jgi:hypothetical protein
MAVGDELLDVNYRAMVILPTWMSQSRSRSISAGVFLAAKHQVGGDGYAG